MLFTEINANKDYNVYYINSINSTYFSISY